MWYTLIFGLERDKQIVFLRIVKLMGILISRKDKNETTPQGLATLFAKLISDQKNFFPDAQQILIQCIHSFENIINTKEPFVAYANVTKNWKASNNYIKELPHASAGELAFVQTKDTPFKEIMAQAEGELEVVDKSPFHSVTILQSKESGYISSENVNILWEVPIEKDDKKKDVKGFSGELDTLGSESSKNKPLSHSTAPIFARSQTLHELKGIPQAAPFERKSTAHFRPEETGHSELAPLKKNKQPRKEAPKRPSRPMTEIPESEERDVVCEIPKRPSRPMTDIPESAEKKPPVRPSSEIPDISPKRPPRPVSDIPVGPEKKPFPKNTEEVPFPGKKPPRPISEVPESWNPKNFEDSNEVSLPKLPARAAPDKRPLPKFVSDDAPYDLPKRPVRPSSDIPDDNALNSSLDSYRLSQSFVERPLPSLKKIGESPLLPKPKKGSLIEFPSKNSRPPVRPSTEIPSQDGNEIERVRAEYERKLDLLRKQVISLGGTPIV